MATLVEPAAVEYGQVRGRYFRENFAQGGLDLAQVVPELVTNADAAIAAAGRARGRIELRFGEVDRDFVRRWRENLRRLGAPALLDWRYQVSCADDGEGVDWATVRERLGVLGELPEQSGQRGLFGRGLRDVWLAQGAGRIEGIRAGRAVETWFFPAAGDRPYAFVPVLDEAATPDVRRRLGIAREGARVTVPLVLRRLPPSWRLRDLVTNLVQIRPVLEDPERELWLELPGEPLQLVAFAPPEPDPERPLLFDGDVSLGSGATARVVVRRAAAPIPLGPRATRRGGLVVRSGRAAHEATLAGLEGRPGARHLYGEVRCEAIERLQRQALDAPRPEVVVRVDRSGLNENHPVVRRLHAALERILRPIVDDEEKRAGAHRVSAGRAIRARDQVGVRALNDALRAAFDAPGSAGFAPGGAPREEPPREQVEPAGGGVTGELPAAPPEPGPAMRFKQSPIRLHPGERRGVSLLFDPVRVPPGTPIEVAADAGLHLGLWRSDVPDPGRLGWSRVSANLRARATAEPGALLHVLAQAGEHAAELEVLVVRHHASGWVRDIQRKDEDQLVEADFEPDTGVVTVYEGRREFRALERAARRAGLPRGRVREYLPYRLLEVEVAANAVYQWAAERIIERRAAEGHPLEPAEYGAQVRLEAQRLRHDHHERLMRAFLEPEVFEGGVRLADERDLPPTQQSLLAG